MATVKLTGFLVDKFPTEQITDTFRKRIFWLTEAQPKNPNYINTWELELHQDDCDLLDQFEVMELLDVEADIRGRKVTVGGSKERVFNALKCVAIGKIASLTKLKTPPRYEDRRRDEGRSPRMSHFPYRQRHQ